MAPKYAEAAMKTWQRIQAQIATAGQNQGTASREPVQDRGDSKRAAEQESGSTHQPGLPSAGTRIEGRCPADGKAQKQEAEQKKQEQKKPGEQKKPEEQEQKQEQSKR